MNIGLFPNSAAAPAAQPPPPEVAPPRQRLTQLRHGFVDALTFAPGVFLLGVIFGANAEAAGIAPMTTFLMSLIVWSGAAQFAALPLWREGIWVVALSALVLSLRFSLMTASLAPMFAAARVPRPVRALLAFAVTDETYALTVTRRSARVDTFYLLGCFVQVYVPWVVGTLLGILLGARVPVGWRGPLEMVFPLVFLALTVMVCTAPSLAVVAVLGAVLSVAGSFLLPGGWNVIAAGILASLAGPLLERWQGTPNEPGSAR